MITRGDELINREFSYVDFGDKRLNKRLVEIGLDFVDSPRQSIPQMCGSWSKTKAAYRFFDNPNVRREEIISSHRERTNRRLTSLDEVLFVSDTTFFTFPNHPAEDQLGEVGKKEDDVPGVLSHNTIAVSGKGGRMKGVYDQQIIIRGEEETMRWKGPDRQEEMDNENEKWNRAIEGVLDEVPESTSPTFVFDRGGDAYPILTQLTGQKAGFIIRANQNRAIRSEGGQRGRLKEWIREKQAMGEMTREVRLDGGELQEVAFQVQAGSCFLLAPHPKRQGLEDEGAMRVNVVRVVQKQPEEGEDPIEWILITDREMDGLGEAREVIDRYECRWVIEDWHECIKKRGTDFEERQLEEWERMDRLLAVLSVIAWRLLGLRNASRQEECAEPGEYLTDAEMKVIEHMDEEVSQGASAKEYFLGIARIGGYLDRNNDPPPGWQILWRGFQEVQLMATGFEMAN
jgi:hypothetical protein